MKIVWFSWKDIGHPQAGGAEIVSHNIRLRLAREGHEVHLITAFYNGSKNKEFTEGFYTHRIGNRYSVYPRAIQYFKQSLLDNTSVVIDEMNTIPFLTPLFIRKKNIRHMLLTYQLARKVWFYQIIPPVSFIGYLLEPVYLYIMRNIYTRVATESKSTKLELVRLGFRSNTIDTFRVGMALKPLKKLAKKSPYSPVLFFGALRPMKRPLEAIRAFEIARDYLPDISMQIAGNDADNYAEKIRDYVRNSRHHEAIKILGGVSKTTKSELMKNAKVILTTSVKEGWGLIVTEANSQGTPAIVYDVSGLKDSVIDKKTGIISKQNPKDMAKSIIEIYSNQNSYESLRSNALEHSRQYTFEASYNDFYDIIMRVHGKKD
jgi:glycosyltransferase involved in cell wall biosynthesis